MQLTVIASVQVHSLHFLLLYAWMSLSHLLGYSLSGSSIELTMFQQMSLHCLLLLIYYSFPWLAKKHKLFERDKYASYSKTFKWKVLVADLWTGRYITLVLSQPLDGVHRMVEQILHCLARGI